MLAAAWWDRLPAHGVIHWDIRRGCRLGLAAFVTALSLMIITTAAGWRVDNGRVCCGGTSLLLLMVVGNYLANLEPNCLMGIRTLWTLEDPATWRATHRLGSRVMVFGSLALFVVVPATGSFGFSAWFYQTHGTAAR